MNEMKRTAAKEYRNCAVCGSAGKRLLFRQQFSAMSEGMILDGYDVVVCEKCGYGFADCLPGQAAFDDYYRGMSKYERQDRGGHQTEFDVRRYFDTVGFIRQHVHDRQSRILDIGCATGGLLHELKKNGYKNVMGLDPSSVCSATAGRLYGIVVLTGALNDVPDDIGTFDVIILGAVAEHLLHVNEALSRVKELLSTEGMVYVDVPDATRFADSCDTPFQEFSIEHINFFSPISLANLLRANEFSPVVVLRTTTEQSAGKMAHEIKALFRKSGGRERASLTCDKETEPALSAYIGCSREIERRIHLLIDAWAFSSRPMIVWGAGTHTQRLLAVSRLAKANIQAFVDSNPRYQGKQFNGIPIVSPAAIKGRNEPILISSRDFQEDIVRQIRDELKYGNELILLYNV